VWENASDFDFSFWIDNDGGVGSESGIQAMFVDDATTNFNDYTKGTWQHVVQTIVSLGDLTTVATYIDGMLVGSDEGPTSAMGNISPVPGLEDLGINFGRARTPASDRPFDGLIDEIGIWSRALSQEEIELLHQLGSQGSSITNSLTGLAISNITRDSTNSQTVIEFTSVPGAIYAVDVSLDLVGWDEENDNLPGTGTLTSFTHITGEERLFYRVPGRLVKSAELLTDVRPSLFR